MPLIVLSANRPWGPLVAKMLADGVLPADVPRDFGYITDRAQKEAQAKLAESVPGATHITNTDSGKGAPPGWYKVIVAATGEPPPPPKGPLKSRPIPKSVVPSKYGLAEKTPLEIEVVASPSAGAYDLKLTAP